MNDRKHHAFKKVCRIGALISTLCLLLVGQAAAQPASLRILTYNTAFVTIYAHLIIPGLPVPPTVTIDWTNGDFGLDYEARAKKLGQLIKQGDQEIVLLQEVFSNEARQVLIDELSPVYPHYISKIQGVPVNEAKLSDFANAGIGVPFPDPIVPFLGSYLADPGDSGLMIFSKYPFLSVPSSAPNEATHWEGSNNGSPLSNMYFAFEVYDQCQSIDCYSSKGVALVWVDTPNQPSYVALTHMQADYPGFNFPLDRALQLDQVKNVLLNTAGANLDYTPVYFAGDLNIVGQNWSKFQTTTEWAKRFHPSAATDGFFSCGVGPCFLGYDGKLLTDGWGFGTSEHDPGKTSEGGNRIDYIMHNWADRLCMQHAMIAWDLSEDGMWFSDHKPVRMDFNTSARWCSPQTLLGSSGPLPITFPTAPCDLDPATPAPTCVQDITVMAKDGARITAPGNFQWFLITEAGSYSIKANADEMGERVAFEIYQAEDLSRPIAPFSSTEHPDFGLPFLMLEPPYYVRVFAADTSISAPVPDRTVGNVDYTINFHRHLCRSATDACFLPPGAVDYSNNWPQLFPQSSDPVADLWFRFQTSGVKGGRLSSTTTPIRYPSVKLMLEAASLDSLGCFEMFLEDYVGLAPPTFVGPIPIVDVEIDQDDHDWDFDGLPDFRIVAPDLDGASDALKDYYVRIHRDPDLYECQLPLASTLRYETTLTYFRPQEIECSHKIDDTLGAKDNLEFRFQFDGEWCIGGCVGPIDLTGGNSSPLSGYQPLQGYYVDSFFPKIEEQDEGYLVVLSGDDGGGMLEPLSPFQKEREWRFVYSDHYNKYEADYWYELTYKQCHKKELCQP